MEHKYENQIKCPYCDWEDSDSWEFSEDDGISACGSCGKEFNVTREIQVSYSTSRIECEEDKHNYQLESHFVSKGKYENMIWRELPETEWTYNRIEMCTECGDKEYKKLTKEEYLLTPLTPSIITGENK